MGYKKLGFEGGPRDVSKIGKGGKGTIQRTTRDGTTVGAVNRTLENPKEGDEKTDNKE